MWIRKTPERRTLNKVDFFLTDKKKFVNDVIMISQVRKVRPNKNTTLKRVKNDKKQTKTKVDKPKKYEEVRRMYM